MKLRGIGSRFAWVFVVSGFAAVLFLGQTIASVNNKYQFPDNLALASRSQQVITLQNYLFLAGYFSDQSTGYFGSETFSAVKAWQKENGIPSTGYFGPLSRAVANNNTLTASQNLLQITIPSNNSEVSGETALLAWLSPRAETVSGGMAIEFVVDGIGYISQSASNPYAAFKYFSPGKHTVYAKEVNSEGVSLISQEISFTVTAPALYSTSTSYIPPSTQICCEDIAATVILSPTISISPTSISLQSGQTTSFTATVGRTTNTAVNWSASLGSINQSGSYTAPTVYFDTTDTVTVTSQDNTGVSASAAVTVTPIPITVSVTPTSTTLADDATTTFSASVANATNTNVTWSATGGSINGSGIYTAPAVFATTTYTVTATSVEDITKSGSASAVVTPLADLLGWYPLNEGTETVALDKSSNANNGSWSGTESGTSGYYSEGTSTGTFAGNFNGSDDEVTVSGFTAAQNIKTIAFWAYLPTLSGTTEMVSKSSGGQGEEVIVNGGEVDYYVMGSAVNHATAPGGSFTIPGWNYLTVTQGGPNSVISIYVDGNLEGTSTAPSSIGDATDLIFGNWNSGGRNFDGELSDIRLYGQEFSASDVQSIYNEEN